MVWSVDTASKVDDAVGRAASGVPTVLDVQGHGGFGKTRLAREIGRRYPRSQVLRATAFEDSRSDPRNVLAQLGVDRDSTPPDALSAVRALGHLIDELAVNGPVVLLLDDLQWADPESIDAVAVLLERMAGDRVLVVAGHRPLGPSHARWRAHLADLQSVVRIVLDGLDEEATFRLLREASPLVGRELTRSLRTHTGGSPLFLQSLLHEYSTEELQARSSNGDLPATADVAAAMRERISRMDPSVVATLSAVAVLGEKGGDLFTIAAVACVEDVREPLRILSADQLVELDGHGPSTKARVFHGIVRAAIYDGVPPTTRDWMHGVAAARSALPAERLRHRVAAAGGTDNGIAVDLEEFADALHERGRFREAAGCRRQSALLSSSVELAARRLLDADFESILALDLDELSIEERVVTTDPHERVVNGAKLAAGMQYAAASIVLAGVSDAELETLPPLAAYRARVMRASAFVASGRSPEAALHDLSMARGSPVIDSALQGYVAIAQGQAEVRMTPVGGWVTIAEMLAMDRAQLAATPQGMMQLAWRGGVMSLIGMPAEAIGDLSIVTSRFDDGVMDFSGGSFHALLGFAHFLNGQWGRASIALDVARTSRLGHPAPLSKAMEPLIGVITGDGVRARAATADARRTLIEGQQATAVQASDIVDVITLFFLGTDDEKARWLPSRLGDLGSFDSWVDEQVLYPWFITQAIGASWAGRTDDAPRWSALLRSVPGLPWAQDGAEWIDARSDTSPRGAERLASIAQRGLPTVPVLDAMLKVEAAWRAHDSLQKSELLDFARAALRALGAEKLVDRLLPPLRDVLPASPDTPAPESLVSGLSGREREVAALLLEGLSYVQIAKELFITRSTVAFHLSRIYAKTNTGTRHDFVQLARTT